ncbi:(d)CMP kinase [bacterium]|nr:(d)CMP kinase [candidate division CSSED10-310 bacterium]
MGLIASVPIDVVAIDGPAGAGKSTVARRVARTLNFAFLDTGAMYRAVALAALAAGITTGNHRELQHFLASFPLTILPDPAGMRLFIGDREVTDEIRRADMGRAASDYSQSPAVRAFCSARQRELGRQGRLVCEGRDMGTVVFPDARWKFFLTASVEERARRRWTELRESGQPQDAADVESAIRSRDAQDMNRELAPLKPAPDAVIIDTTHLTLNEVADRLLANIQGRGTK